MDDADYPEALRISASMNPLRALRQQWSSVRRLTWRTSDRFQVGVGLACAHIERPEIRIQIGAGTGVEIDGATRIAFTVRTNSEDIRCCVVEQDHAAVYEYIPANVPNIPNMYSDPDVMVKALNDGRLKDVVGPRAGARLSRVNAALIDDVVALSKEHRAGLALDALLRQAGIEPRDAQAAALIVVPHPEGDMVRWMLLAGNKPLQALTTPNGAALMPWGGTEPIARIGRRDLDAHAERIAAGSMEAKPL